MIGPNIPEHLLKKTNEAEIEISLSDDEEQEIGPKIPSSVLQKENTEEINVADEDQSIGPQIPAHLLQKKKNTNETSIVDEEDKTNIGPQIPAHLFKRKNTDEISMSDEEEQVNIGPQIPKHVLQQNEITTADEEGSVGPQLPSHSPQQETETPDDFAPALPPDLLEKRRKQQQPQQPQRQQPGRRRRPVGPSLPAGFVPQDDDDYVVGPSLPTNYNPEEEAKYSAIQAIEERARQAKEAMEKKKEDKGKVERPEWMLLPPEVDYLKQANSSKSRQFTNKVVSKEDLDNSGWTDTPADRERKLKEGGKRKATDVEIDYSAADLERRMNIEQYNMQTRPMSLMEMHQLKRKKEKRSGAEDVTKRPFDREKDLLGSRPMDKKQKKELLRQTNELNKGFGYGRSSFL